MRWVILFLVGCAAAPEPAPELRESVIPPAAVHAAFQSDHGWRNRWNRHHEVKGDWWHVARNAPSRVLLIAVDDHQGVPGVAYAVSEWARLNAVYAIYPEQYKNPVQGAISKFAAEVDPVVTIDLQRGWHMAADVTIGHDGSHPHVVQVLAHELRGAGVTLVDQKTGPVKRRRVETGAYIRLTVNPSRLPVLPPTTGPLEIPADHAQRVAQLMEGLARALRTLDK